jgi:hypothetical protein
VALTAQDSLPAEQRADKDLFEAREMLQHCGSFEAELESQIDAVERGRQQMEQQMDPVRQAALSAASRALRSY